MKYLKQFMIILAISFAGEILKLCLPLPIPASIYGMLLMLVALLTGILKLRHVKETGRFLIEIMPVMFIPAGVGLIDSWGQLCGIIVPVSIVTVAVLIIVMVVTGRVAQRVIIFTQKFSGHTDKTN